MHWNCRSSPSWSVPNTATFHPEKISTDTFTIHLTTTLCVSASYCHLRYLGITKQKGFVYVHRCNRATARIDRQCSSAFGACMAVRQTVMKHGHTHSYVVLLSAISSQGQCCRCIKFVAALVLLKCNDSASDSYFARGSAASQPLLGLLNTRHQHCDSTLEHVVSVHDPNPTWHVPIL